MRYLFSILLVCYFLSAASQSVITGWIRNTTGKKGGYWYNNGDMPPTYTFTISTDSADVLTVAYSTSPGLYMVMAAGDGNVRAAKFFKP